MQKNFKQHISFKIFYKLLVIIAFQQIAPLILAQPSGQDINKIRTVVLDPGHGGKDPGALGKQSKEKDIVLSICLKAGAYIEEYFPDVKVIYTRDKDVFIPLDERPQIANEANADLFISVHANWNENSKAYGSETFVMGLHKTEGNLEVAKKENSVIIYEEDYEMKYEGFDPDDIESYIMFSIVTDIYRDYSLIAASLVQDQFRERVKRKDRGVKQAGFWVLWKTSMPSILIEAGFVSNPVEEAFLMSEQGQDYLASAIFRAFRNYKENMEGTLANNSNSKSIVNEIDSLEKTNIEKTSETNTQHTLPLSTPKKKPEYLSNIEQETKPKSIKEIINQESDGTKFKIQILNSEDKIELNNEMFNDFNDIEEISVSGSFKYVVGSANSYQEAVEYSKWVKSRYPDAFIVAVSNGKIVPLSEALNEKSN